MKTKAFDAVELMRNLRDALSREMEQMTPEERIRYIRQRAASTALGKRIEQGKEDVDPYAPSTGRSPSGR